MTARRRLRHPGGIVRVAVTTPASSTETELTLRGRVDAPRPITVHVALLVRDDRLQSSGAAGEIDLVLDDGRTVRVAFDGRTHARGLRETRTRGRWERLSQEPDARLVSDRAPGPHVAASLVRTVLEPGARIEVRGAVVAWTAPAREATSYRDAEDSPVPARVVAAAIADV